MLQQINHSFSHSLSHEMFLMNLKSNANLHFVYILVMTSDKFLSFHYLVLISFWFQWNCTNFKVDKPG